MINNILIILFILLLIKTSILDVKSKQISNYYVVLIIIISLFYISDIPLLQRFIEGTIILVPLILIWLVWKRGIGAGDIKLIFACTLMLGLKEMLWGLFFGMVIAGVVGIIYILKKQSIEYPLVPFISFGILITIFIK